MSWRATPQFTPEFAIKSAPSASNRDGGVIVRAIAPLMWTALFSTAALCQSPESSPAFEVASINASIQNNNGFSFMRGPALRGGRYEVRLATMVDLIGTAYHVDTEKVVGGPNWLEMDRFDIMADY